MSGRPRKPPREKDLTSRFLSGGLEEDGIEQEHFGDRTKHAQQRKIERTAILRATESAAEDLETLPVGQVIQVFSLYYEVEHPAGNRLCVVRKTMAKLSNTGIVVGDLVRFRDGKPADDPRPPAQEAPLLLKQLPEAVIEQVLPRKTLLTRTDSFKSVDQHPIVANAEQMLIVVSLIRPEVKWGLVDRMIVAARAGGLTPIVCLNKTDLADTDADAAREMEFAAAALTHYGGMGVVNIQTSAESASGLDLLRDVLRDKITVLSGHSGVGKSSLIAAVQPGLNLRIGEISNFTAKGRHTTTSARRYPLDIGGYVIDTPGVKLFGLWGVTRENLGEFFPDVASGAAPEWRQASYERIAASLAG